MIKTCIINKMKYKHLLYINIRCTSQSFGQSGSPFPNLFLSNNGYTVWASYVLIAFERIK